MGGAWWAGGGGETDAAGWVEGRGKRTRRAERRSETNGGSRAESDGADCARGGNVTVSSSIGHGSAFVLTRPAPADVRVALAGGDWRENP
jgi:hypothetical protein